MSGSTFGNIFRISTWGESHGKALGVVIDGCPAGLELCEEDIQVFLDRRKPGQSKYVTQRKESDTVEILSGVFEGRTTGTPISLIVRNESQRSGDYSEIAGYYRPGHADYTFDEKYKAGLLSNMDKAYETRRLFLKEKCKTFTLEKEIRDLDVGSLGERNVLNKIYDALVRKYNLSTSTADNKLRFMAAGYQFGDEIIGHALYGEYVRTDMVAESTTYYTTRKRVNTHKHGIELLHSVDAIKSTIGMQSAKVKTILERLFRRGGSSYKKLLLLDTSEFYAFIINNEHRLKEEFREVTADMNTQMTLPLNPKKSIFHIPEQDFYKYDPGVKNEVEYLTNAYHDYTSGYATSLVRSTSEMLFEQFCESRDDIEWVYKNGDTGQQYFSIVYRDGLQNQWLFYADYIIMKKDGTVWVIETKGGESKGKDKNIDIQIENKFNAFKNYATEHSLHWGFVRDKDNQLYINNTEFTHDMSDDHWVPLSQEF